MTKILLVGEFLAHRSFNGANKALPVLASSLANGGYDCVQLDLERPDVAIDDVCREATDADLVAFAGAMTPQWPELDEHCRILAAHLDRVGRCHVPLMVGGYATKGVEDIARETPWISAFFDGEGEDAVLDVAAWAARGAPREAMRDIPGLCFVDDGGRWRRSIAPRVRDLDNVDQAYGFTHIPSVHDMDIFVGPDGRQLKTGQIYTQRGCPWACSYCNKSMEGPAVVRLSEDVFRRQLHELKEQGYEAVYLDVDTFAVNRDAAYSEADILAEEGMVWGSNTRIDTASRDFVRYLVERGCVYMFFGVEHTHPGVLLAIDKFNGSLPIKLRRIAGYRDAVRRVFRDMSAVGLPSSYFLILGLPKAVLTDDRSTVARYEPTTFEDDVEAIAFGLDECEPDYLNFNMLRFMPGSTAADVPYHPAYECVRPSGAQPITSGHFLPRVAEALGYHVPENHGVYRLCESVGRNQPTTTAVDAERVHASIQVAVDMINARIDAGRVATRLFVDTEIREAGLLTTDEDGRYTLAPLAAFDGL
jgi:anaerobic magnesium-protoporphyrin IX monomethyl ester cyclase